MAPRSITQIAGSFSRGSLRCYWFPGHLGYLASYLGVYLVCCRSPLLPLPLAVHKRFWSSVFPFSGDRSGISNVFTSPDQPMGPASLLGPVVDKRLDAKLVIGCRIRIETPLRNPKASLPSTHGTNGLKAATSSRIPLMEPGISTRCARFLGPDRTHSPAPLGKGTHAFTTS